MSRFDLSESGKRFALHFASRVQPQLRRRAQAIVKKAKYKTKFLDKPLFARVPEDGLLQLQIDTASGTRNVYLANDDPKSPCEGTLEFMTGEDVLGQLPEDMDLLHGLWCVFTLQYREKGKPTYCIVFSEQKEAHARDTVTKAKPGPIRKSLRQRGLPADPY